MWYSQCSNNNIPIKVFSAMKVTASADDFLFKNIHLKALN